MIKKIILLIGVLLLITSCSRSIYYAYQRGDIYATLELTKRNDIIYRTKSDLYNNNYLYIDAINLKERNEKYVSIGESFTLSYININGEYKACFPLITENLIWSSYITYKKKSDSLSLLWTPEIKKKLLKEPCFKETGITWFPPYLKRIKKIDYKKFKLPYKKKYLRTMNPKHR